MKRFAVEALLYTVSMWACSGGSEVPAPSNTATGGVDETTQTDGPSGGQTAGAPGSAQGATGGGSTTSGGAANASGAAAVATGGAQAAAGGTQGSTGGSQTSAGGSQGSTGGTQAATGGAQTSAGGTQGSTGGLQGSTGGLQNTGGTQNAGGLQNTGGTQNAGGTQNSGTPVLGSSDADPTYATSGPWHGYIWPAVDWLDQATISPSASEGFRAGGPPYCVTGNVPPTNDLTAVAMIGMNTNQERAGGAVAAEWTPTGTGILVNVSNPGGSPLRLQIQTNETGAVGEEWCAMLTVFDQDVVVPWSDFYQHEQCADQVGTPFSETMVGIATVMVLVPGTTQAGGYDFDFCVNEMTPV